MKIAIIGVVPESIYNFRGDLIKRMISEGHDVIVFTEPCSDLCKEKMRSLGVAHRVYYVRRGSCNFLHDLATFVSLFKLLYEEKIEKSLCYTIKPVIWGGLASALNRLKFYALVTGLGYSFHSETVKGRLVGIVARRLYRLSLAFSEKVFFQNTDDMYFFVSNNIVGEGKPVLVNGSGVNLKHYEQAHFPVGDIVFLCVARLLVDKGLREYYAAAKIVKNRHPHCRFLLVGAADPSPAAIPVDEVLGWNEEGSVEYLGTKEDVREVIKECHVYVLPSYHEGTPRSVLEAMSMGRPIITTDTPGCRETVVPPRNGFLVPHKDVDALAMAMESFVNNSNLIHGMGSESRKIAVDKYDVEKVNDLMMMTMSLDSV